MAHFSAAIEDLLKSFGNLFAGVFGTISNIVTGFFSMIVHFFTSFADLITGTFKGAVEMIGGLGRFIAGEHPPNPSLAFAPSLLSCLSFFFPPQKQTHARAGLCS